MESFASIVFSQFCVAGAAYLAEQLWCPSDNVEVSALYVYPIKSCGGVKVESWPVDRLGFLHDRSWLVVEKESGRFVTQRQYPQMCLISCRFTDTDLVASYPGKPDLKIPLKPNPAAAVRDVTVWRETLKASAVSSDSDEWFSSIIAASVSLVSLVSREGHQRSAGPKAVQGVNVAFSDQMPFLVVSEASMTELNKRAGEPIAINRFRPNIVVKNCGANEEDRWESLKIVSPNGDAIELDQAEECGRCSLPNVDQATAERNPRNQPTKALRAYRLPAKGKSPLFGSLMLQRQTSGKIEVGGKVVILKVRQSTL